MKRKAHNLNFPYVPIAEAVGQRGKHAKIVSDILSDLEKIDQYGAIKVDLAQLGEKKSHLRAALHRAAKKKKIGLASTSDETHLYIFRLSSKTR